VHTYIENEVMYPEVCALLPDLKDDVLESYEEHHVADVLCVSTPGKNGSSGAESRRQASVSTRPPLRPAVTL
jgi:hypothetical protein